MYQLSNELREIKLSRTEFRNLKRFPIVCVLESLSNMHNVGIIIRICEAFRIEKLIVYSKVDILKPRKVLKSSLSAYGIVNSINVSSAVGIVLSHAVNARRAQC